jgi:hypothetical protein
MNMCVALIELETYNLEILGIKISLLKGLMRQKGNYVFYHAKVKGHSCGTRGYQVGQPCMIWKNNKLI